MNDILYTVHVDGTDKKFKKRNDISGDSQEHISRNISMILCWYLWMDDFRNCSRHWKLIVS